MTEMLTKLYKTPWIWFGGKADAAPAVWDALGDCEHYVEPFCGSLAVLLRRPHLENRAYHSETVNDADGLLVNAWRSIQLSPDETAAAASNPVAEADLHARHLDLVRWRQERNIELLMGDPAWHDPIMGGWWIWGCSCWIGGGWCAGDGPWSADESGRFRKSGEPGVSRRLPQLSDDGRGVNRPQAREPGVTRQLPRLGNDGQGVNRPQAREPGVTRQLPRLGNDGQDDVNPYHAVTMPEAVRWMRYLSARLRHVRILNGDWKRCVTSGALKTLQVRKDGKSFCGVFLDPPYGTAAHRAGKMYAVDSMDVAGEALAWCVENGGDPKYRIVLAGFEGEHEALREHGWRSFEWFKSGFLKGGMGLMASLGSHQQHRERLWISPHCLAKEASPQLGFFDEATPTGQAARHDELLKTGE